MHAPLHRAEQVQILTSRNLIVICDSGVPAAGHDVIARLLERIPCRHLRWNHRIVVFKEEDILGAEQRL